MVLDGKAKRDVNPGGEDCSIEHPEKQLKEEILAHGLISNLIFYLKFWQPAVSYIEMQKLLRDDSAYEPYI